MLFYATDFIYWEFPICGRTILIYWKNPERPFANYAYCFSETGKDRERKSVGHFLPLYNWRTHDITHQASMLFLGILDYAVIRHKTHCCSTCDQIFHQMNVEGDNLVYSHHHMHYSTLTRNILQMNFWHSIQDSPKILKLSLEVGGFP